MAYPPSERILANAEVLNQYLGEVLGSILGGQTISFFSTNSLDIQELLLKASREAKSHGTFSEAETSQQINYISAVIREAGMAQASRTAFYNSASEEIVAELDHAKLDSYLRAKVVEGNTKEQKGMA